MKLLILFLFIVSCLHVQSQRLDISAANIDSILVNDKINLVYINAAWCLPCVQKLDTLLKLYPQIQHKTNLIVLFDRMGFNEEKERNRYSFYTSKPFYLMDKKYYQPQKKGWIQVQVNSQKQVFKNLKNDLTAHYNFQFPKNTLLFGNMLFIKNKEVKFIEGTGHSSEEFIAMVLEAVK